jgi:hypothetical protein
MSDWGGNHAAPLAPGGREARLSPAAIGQGSAAAMCILDAMRRFQTKFVYRWTLCSTPVLSVPEFTFQMYMQMRRR